MTTNLEKIRAKCVEANPDIEVVVQTLSEKGKIVERRPIRLADVLLAVEANKHIHEVFTVYPNGIMAYERQDDSGFPQEQATETWNLRTDDLEQQSPETLEFIANVLRV